MNVKIYMLARGSLMTIIGPRETVFHHLPNIDHFENIGVFLTALRGGRDDA